MGFKAIETKEEFIMAARARLLWGNYQTEEAGPSQWETIEWHGFDASLIYDIWDKAERERDPNTWRTFDFAVLVEDDEEEDASPTANVECDSKTTVSGD